jgi:hypothetical protein
MMTSRLRAFGPLFSLLLLTPSVGLADNADLGKTPALQCASSLFESWNGFDPKDAPVSVANAPVSFGGKTGALLFTEEGTYFQPLCNGSILTKNSKACRTRVKLPGREDFHLMVSYDQVLGDYDDDTVRQAFANTSFSQAILLNDLDLQDVIKGKLGEPSRYKEEAARWYEQKLTGIMHDMLMRANSHALESNHNPWRPRTGALELEIRSTEGEIHRLHGQTSELDRREIQWLRKQNYEKANQVVRERKKLHDEIERMEEQARSLRLKINSTQLEDAIQGTLNDSLDGVIPDTVNGIYSLSLQSAAKLDKCSPLAAQHAEIEQLLRGKKAEALSVANDPSSWIRVATTNMDKSFLRNIEHLSIDHPAYLVFRRFRAYGDREYRRERLPITAQQIHDAAMAKDPDAADAR